MKLALQLRRLLGALLARKRISGKQWANFWNTLRPVENGHPLIRIGGSNDGGYLIPEDLVGVSRCISPGVSNMFEFEKELLEKWSIPSLLVDASITLPNLPDVRLEFLPKYLGPENSASFISLSSLVSESLDNGYASNFLLQMDIEGWEIPVLASTPLKILNRFRILVIEFHNLQEWQSPLYFQTTIEPVFAKLTDIFDVVHAHPNNCDGIFYSGKRIYPRSIEVTFHNKERNSWQGGNSLFRKLPHPLDRNNSNQMPKIQISFD